MSRFPGGMSLARTLSISKSPSVRSSRPAIKRSKVDLPHPEGPTRTTNSPGAMSRLMSNRIRTTPKLFATDRNRTLPINRPPIEPFGLEAGLSWISGDWRSRSGAAPGQAADQEPLHQQVDDDDRNGDDRQHREQIPGVRQKRIRVEQRDEGQRLQFGLVDRDQREDEFVERGQELKNYHDGERRPTHRHHDAPVDGEARSALEHGRLFHLLGQALKETAQDDDRERGAESRVGQDEAEIAVQQPEV